MSKRSRVATVEIDDRHCSGVDPKKPSLCPTISLACPTSVDRLQWRIPRRSISSARSTSGSAQVQLDVFTQLDRFETDLHGRWPTTEAVMLSHQIWQLLAAQQQLERAALAWCPLDESQLLQA